MHILVTGSAGFIGFHLANGLLDGGHTVVGLDNFNDYYMVALKRDRHALLARRKGYSGVEADICDRDVLATLFKAHRFDRVCHLAAQAGVRYSMMNPFAYQKTNLEGFLNILETCRHAQVPRLVYASSSSVYGGNAELPFREDDRVDHPISLYAATKKANELMAHTYSHLYGLQTIGLRFFTVYGPWGRPDMAMWLFAEAMLAGKPIQVFNHGKMRRDFTFIDDIIQGVMGALFTETLGRCELFNIGNHRSENLMDMIGLLSQALGVVPQLQLLPMQPGDVPETYADISRIEARCGYHPTTPISVGIPKFVDWYLGYSRKRCDPK